MDLNALIISKEKISKENFENKSFLEVMEKHNLKIKNVYSVLKPIACYILFEDESQNENEPKNWILERDADRSSHILKTRKEREE
ncbi:MAG TPA: hypothetical protein HA306_07225 [Methanosarcina sp.]|nr:hypothetical protein [Methanosarcina sp.]